MLRRGALLFAGFLVLASRCSRSNRSSLRLDHRLNYRRVLGQEIVRPGSLHRWSRISQHTSKAGLTLIQLFRIHNKARQWVPAEWLRCWDSRVHPRRMSLPPGPLSMAIQGWVQMASTSRQDRSSVERFIDGFGTWMMLGVSKASGGPCRSDRV
jgi:hypothetical protein